MVVFLMANKFQFPNVTTMAQTVAAHMFVTIRSVQATRYDALATTRHSRLIRPT